MNHRGGFASRSLLTNRSAPLPAAIPPLAWPISITGSPSPTAPRPSGTFIRFVDITTASKPTATWAMPALNQACTSGPCPPGTGTAPTQVAPTYCRRTATPNPSVLPRALLGARCIPTKMTRHRSEQRQRRIGGEGRHNTDADFAGRQRGYAHATPQGDRLPQMAHRRPGAHLRLETLRARFDDRWHGATRRGWLA